MWFESAVAHKVLRLDCHIDRCKSGAISCTRGLSKSALFVSRSLVVVETRPSRSGRNGSTQLDSK